MRVLLDTSVLISYLCSSQPATSATGALLRSALTGGFTLLFVAGVIEEFRRKLQERPDLAARIPLQDVEDLVAGLRFLSFPSRIRRSAGTATTTS